MRLNLVTVVIVVSALVGCSSDNQDLELQELQDRVAALETGATASTADGEVVNEAPSQPQSDEPAPPTLVEYWGTRGIRALAPVNWNDSLSDGMGSGSSAKWWNPDDPEERIDVSTGVSKGMWYETDGVEGSISPELMISETADIYQQSRTVFVYVDSEDDIATLGVWRITQSYDGDDCCYYKAQIRLRYHNGVNAHFWNMFLEHQLQVVAGTDFDVEFQHHQLADRFS
jgi:hypothetical protein